MYVCQHVKVYRNHVMSLLSEVAVVGVKLATIGKSGLMVLSLFRLKCGDDASVQSVTSSRLKSSVATIQCGGECEIS